MVYLNKFFEYIGADTRLEKVSSLTGLGSLASILGLLVTILIVIFNDKDTTALSRGLLVLLLLAIGFIVLSVYFNHTRIKQRNAKLKAEVNTLNDEIANLQSDNKYRYSYVHLNSGFSGIHSITRGENSATDMRTVAFEKLCTHIGQMFLSVKGKKCGVCIKVFVKDGKETFRNSRVETFVRDQQFNNARNHDKEGKIEHFLYKNSDFERILDELGGPKGQVYIDNNIPIRRDYKNSSFELHGLPWRGGLPEDWNDEQRRENWPLPYRSTIIVPICPNVSSERTIDKLLGFFCVDCSEEDVFNQDSDGQILIGVADGIYNVFRNTLLKIASESGTSKQKGSITVKRLK